MSSTVTPIKQEHTPAMLAAEMAMINTGSTTVTDASTVSPVSTFGGSVPPTPIIVGANGIINKVRGLAVADSGKVVEAPKSSPYTPPAARFRNSKSFVIHSNESRRDDPFGSSSNEGECSSQNSGRSSHSTTSSSRRGDALSSANWRSASHQSDSPTLRKSNSVSSGILTRVQSKDPGINSDRVSNRNAQAIYAPSACVFVANLHKGTDEETLEYLVTKKFREYGTVWVKIRRDPRDMPFAFCQYTNDSDAERALKQGRGFIIQDRPCRTEKAKANRTYYMSRLSGEAISNIEAHEVVEAIGPLSRTWKASATEKALYRLAEGIFIEFAFYEDGRNALMGFRDNDEYRLEQLNALDQNPARGCRSSTKDSEAAKYLQRYDVDRRSVFVGNLPQGATRDVVKDIFGTIGEVVEVEVISRESIHNGMSDNVFAFVEFESDASVQAAISTKHGFDVGGNTIKVFQKDSEGAKPRRAVGSIPLKATAYLPSPCAPKSTPIPSMHSSFEYQGPHQSAFLYQPSANAMSYQTQQPVYAYQYATTPYYVPFVVDGQTSYGYAAPQTAVNYQQCQPYGYTQHTATQQQQYVPMTTSDVYYAPYSPAGQTDATFPEATAEDRTKTPTPQNHGVGSAGGGVPL